MALEFIDPELIPYMASFLFTFAVVYGLLIITGVFTDAQGKKNTNVITVIALVFAIFSILYEPYVTILYTVMPIATAILIILFFIYLVNEMRKKTKGAPLPVLGVLTLLLIVLAVTWSDIEAYLPADFASEDTLWIIGIVVVLIMFWLAWSGQSSEPQRTSNPNKPD